MENIQIIEIENPDKTISEVVIIDRGNNEFTSMTKATYEAMLASNTGGIN